MALTENQRKWVEALRSGEYKQGKEWLNRGGKMCCLGVACEVARANGLQIARSGSTDIVSYDDSDTAAPESVMKWLGLSDELGSYTAGNHVGTDLASNNDKGWSFAKIADRIESEPKGLFVEAE